MVKKIRWNIRDSAWKPKYICGTDSGELICRVQQNMFITGSQRVSVPKKGSFEATLRMPALRLCRFFSFRPPRFRLLNHWCRTRHIHKRCRSAHLFKMMLNPWKFLLGGEPICMNIQYISIKNIGLHEQQQFCQKTQGFGMTRTMDFCNTWVGRRQKVRREPFREVTLLFAVNWDPLICCVYQ